MVYLCGTKYDLFKESEEGKLRTIRDYSDGE